MMKDVKNKLLEKAGSKYSSKRDNNKLPITYICIYLIYVFIYYYLNWALKNNIYNAPIEYFEIISQL